MAISDPWLNPRRCKTVSIPGSRQPPQGRGTSRRARSLAQLGQRARSHGDHSERPLKCERRPSTPALLFLKSAQLSSGKTSPERGRAVVPVPACNKRCVHHPRSSRNGFLVAERPPSLRLLLSHRPHPHRLTNSLEPALASVLERPADRGAEVAGLCAERGGAKPLGEGGGVDDVGEEDDCGAGGGACRWLRRFCWSCRSRRHQSAVSQKLVDDLRHVIRLYELGVGNERGEALCHYPYPVSTESP